MTSIKTLLPVDYYKLPFCLPKGGPKMDNENLGEFLSGDRIESSPYELKMLEETYCKQLCVADLGAAENSKRTPNRVVRAIRKEYHNNWIVDNLSAASRVENDTETSTKYWQGFPVGFVSPNDDKAYIYNHVNIEIDYHPVEDQTDKYRVVGFVVEPFSIAHDFDVPVVDDKDNDDDVKIKNPIVSCDPKKSKRQHTDYDMVMETGRDPQVASGQVLFTYDVTWHKNETLKWASRWDIYLSMNDAIPAKIHWLSITNSLVLVICLSASVIAILMRNLRRDLTRYNRIPTDEETTDARAERGWVSVQGDVFRPPSTSPLLLCVCCGTGAQLLCMTFWTIVLSAVGYLNPSRRGYLLTAEIVFFVLMGSVAGYVTTRLYKTFSGTDWQKAAAYTALGFPGLCFVSFFLFDIEAWSYGSSDAVPFTTMLVLLFLWFGISSPLVFLGAHFGYKQEAIEFPVKTSRIERPIPGQPWFMGPPVTLMIGGIIPFGACFVELYYIMASVWMEFYYYVFGFLLVVFCIVVITCAEIAILSTHFQLCKGNYRWWWRSFLTGGSMAGYMFLYSIMYFKQLETNTFSSYVIFFGYMTLVCLSLFLMTGFIGVSSSLWFNKTIFGALKVD